MPIMIPEVLFNVKTLEELRHYQPVTSTGTRAPMDGDIVYVRCHTYNWDGGGGFFVFYYPNNQYFPDETMQDNDGTIIEAYTKDLNVEPGRWIRSYDGYLNVCFFGVRAFAFTNAGERIQKAIDFASLNGTTGYETKSSVLYFPAGVYEIQNTIILRSGVSLIGDSTRMVELRAGYNLNNDGWMIEMDKGRIEGCTISNFRINGNCNFESKEHDARTKGCMYFEARVENLYGAFDGGMWNCRFSNLLIINFNGGGIYLIGGGEDSKPPAGPFLIPNQLLIFENVYVVRQKAESQALLMTGEQGQLSFINCGFDGKLYNQIYTNEPNPELVSFEALKGINVSITNRGYVQTAVISFLNCTFQQSEYGIFIKFAESITFDTCWFENLDMAVSVFESDESYPSKGINVLNCRFANASGFGSLNCVNRNVLPEGEIAGRCVTSVNSEVNIFNCYVTVSSVSKLPNNFVDPFISKAFIIALKQNKGIRTIGNTFLDNRLGRTSGILRNYDIVNNAIDLQDTKLATISGISSNPPIDSINCSICAGEILTVRSANQNPITFTNNKNIYLSNKAAVTLNHGDIATFIKLEDIGGPTHSEIYHMISIFKSSTLV